MPHSPFAQPRGVRSADSPEAIPAAGVMLHLLGAVALGWSVIIWAALVVFDVITASVLGVAVASIALTGAAAWAVWLVRATRDRDPEDGGPDFSGTASTPLDGDDLVDPEEHFHPN